MKDDSLPYESRRAPLFAKNIVATSQPLAAQAGLNILKVGGNAVDAAIATAITLTVVEPTGNGLGSDAFAIVWDGKQLHGVNGSGKSPKAWSRKYFEKYDEMPQFGWDTVTVPGAVSTWVALSEKFGKLPFERLFEEAIRYGESGFHVGFRTAYDWNHGPESWYSGYDAFRDEFLPAPKTGDLIVRPDISKTLSEIAVTKGESFYRGSLAEKIEKAAKTSGGGLRLEDLEDHETEFVKLISQNFHDVCVHEIPPNGQGIAALIALGILEKRPLDQLDSLDSFHVQIEAMKVGLFLADRYVADPKQMKLQPADLLDGDLLREYARKIDKSASATPPIDRLKGGDTVYLSACDSSGVMVSFIQSNYFGFGSGIVVPGTGIALQNRGWGFTLERGHPNEVGPGKKPFHTIIPGFLTKGSRPFGSFGVMGGPMQAQGHLQMINRIVNYHQNPQAASDAPRWQILSDFSVAVEPGFPSSVAEGLVERGHKVKYTTSYHSFGGAQIVLNNDNGYVAGSDHRKEGAAVGF